MTFAYKEGDHVYGPYQPGKEMNILKAGKNYHVVSEENGVLINNRYFPPGKVYDISVNRSIISLSRRQQPPEEEFFTFFLD